MSTSRQLNFRVDEVDILSIPNRDRMSRPRNGKLVGTDLIDTVIEAEWQESGKHAANNIQSLGSRETLDFGEELSRIMRHDAA